MELLGVPLNHPKGPLNNPEGLLNHARGLETLKPRTSFSRKTFYPLYFLTPLFVDLWGLREPRKEYSDELRPQHGPRMGSKITEQWK